MKVVLFCGGYGMRMRGDDGAGLPKPLQLVGELPLVVHVMHYYAAHGHTDFILCLGYAAEQVQAAVTEAVLRCPGASRWSVTYADTGLDTPIGERLHQVAHLVRDEPMFFANYADVLSDVPLDAMVARMEAHPQASAMMLAVRPQASFHVVDLDGDDTVTGLHSVAELPVRENGGYLLLRPSILDHLGDGKDLVTDAFSEVIPDGGVLGYPHDGFWMPADTFKERAALHAMWQAGTAPWALAVGYDPAQRSGAVSVAAGTSAPVPVP